MVRNLSVLIFSVNTIHYHDCLLQTEHLNLFAEKTWVIIKPICRENVGNH